MHSNMNPNELPLTTEALADRSIAIKLVGVGGAGSNAVDRLKMENLERLQMAVINTDYQALSTSPVQDKVLIGTSITRGLSSSVSVTSILSPPLMPVAVRWAELKLIMNWPPIAPRWPKRCRQRWHRAIRKARGSIPERRLLSRSPANRSIMR